MISELPNILELHLNGFQAYQFKRFIDRQKSGEQLTVFAVIAHSFDPAAGRATVRLQATSVLWPIAKKVIKLLRSADAPEPAPADSAAPIARVAP